MRQIIALVSFVLMIVIHTLDMELTINYIGNDWVHETFLPMSLTIRYLGIYKAVWVSRIIMYSFFFYFLMNQEKKWVNHLMINCNILYWASMICWLFTLNILQWPSRF